MKARVPSLLPSLLALALWAAACGPGAPPAPIPRPDLSEMEPRVSEAIAAAQEAIEESPRSADAWGRFGMVSHAHDLFDEAAAAYRQAATLAPEEMRWHYYLGDVLFTVGTEMEEAERHLRRAAELEPGYGGAHLRLGKALFALGRPEAGAEFEKALELDGQLLPAKVGLGQVRLAEGRAAEAAALLEEVLDEQPRNGRALATLAQAYTRLGRRDEARDVAEQSQDAADYNLFPDPLMSEVVALGVSSNVLWARAKAYLEAGDYRQAILGLTRVVALLPENPGVHHQLAFAYRETGDRERALRHLERAVELEPERADARVQLAGLLIEGGAAEAAVEHLRRVYEAAPDDPEAGWLLASALVRGGDTAAAVAVFRDTAARASRTGSPVPAQAHDDWGNALAQQGRFEDAAEHFRAALEADPDNAQSLFHLGLAMEGLGRRLEAVGYYERAMAISPNDLIASRLDALGSDGP